MEEETIDIAINEGTILLVAAIIYRHTGERLTCEEATDAISAGLEEITNQDGPILKEPEHVH